MARRISDERQHRRMVKNISSSKVTMPSLPTLFNIFLERVICDAQADHDLKVNIGGRTITHLRSPHCSDAQDC